MFNSYCKKENLHYIIIFMASLYFSLTNFQNAAALTYQTKIFFWLDKKISPKFWKKQTFVILVRVINLLIYKFQFSSLSSWKWWSKRITSHNLRYTSGKPIKLACFLRCVTFLLTNSLLKTFLSVKILFSGNFSILAREKKMKLFRPGKDSTEYLRSPTINNGLY